MGGERAGQLVSLDTAWEVSDDVVVRDLDGEAVLLNLASGIYFGLDPVATRVWQLIDEHGNLASVLAAMREEFDAPADVLERDVLRLASELAAKGLVVARDGRAGS
jgi:Coenzyme PQQ synthesis protein D (PqqD)